MIFRETLAYLLLGTTLIFGGCNQSRRYLEGEVIKESGSVVSVVKSDDAFFGNESVKFGNPNYVLRVKTEEGVYTIDVHPSYHKSLLSLAEAINVGDRVRFRVNNEGFFNRADFSEDKIGRLSGEGITILKK